MQFNRGSSLLVVNDLINGVKGNQILSKLSGSVTELSVSKWGSTVFCNLLDCCFFR